MCGRTCLTLEPDEICDACTYPKTTKSGNTKWKKPSWRPEYNCGRQYKPSYNLAPTDISPVLVSAAHFEFDASENEQICSAKSANDSAKQRWKDDRVVVPMLWGMIPFWHSSSNDYRKHGLITNNCRRETMLDSKLYKNAFHKGQRCVVLCEGFYEWQTTDPKAKKSSERSAYYIYMPQRDGVRIEDKSTWQSITSAGDLTLLKMAGLFDVWKNAEGDKIFSYSIITFESDDTLNWLHHRSPAILETDDQVADWLDFKRNTDTTHLLGLLKPPKQIKWHRVSNLVNNSRNKSEQCNKVFDGDDKKRGDGNKSAVTPESKMMRSWLIVKKRANDNDDVNDKKENDEKEGIQKKMKS